MIKQLLSPAYLIGFVIVFSACKKDKPAAEPKDAIPQYLLKNITWNYGVTAVCSYNSDSILKYMDYTYQNVNSKTVYNWAGKQLRELYDDGASYKNVFEYDAAGRVANISRVDRSENTSVYTLEFHYNTAKQIDTLKYFTINEAGKRLRATSVYHYNQAGDLEEVVSIWDYATITHTISAWSPAISFNPCPYLETALNENYTIYNYAMLIQLQQRGKLPAKVTRVVKTASAPSYIDKIEEMVFTVNNYRIDKAVTTISYPDMGYSNSSESVYGYY